METLKETTDQKPSKSKYVPPTISPGDADFVNAQLQSELGRALLETLEPISRRDLHPKNLNISYDPELKAIDIHIVFVDTNTPLWTNLQKLMWRNRMTWRFDGTGPQLMLILRWFLPYEFPIQFPEAPPMFPSVQPEPPSLEEIPPTAEEEVGQTKQSTIEDKPQAVSE